MKGASLFQEAPFDINKIHSSTKKSDVIYIMYIWTERRNKRCTTAWKVSVFRVIWSTFSRIRTEFRDTPYLSVFSPNAEKCGPEKLRIRIILTQCHAITYCNALDNTDKFSNHDNNGEKSGHFNSNPANICLFKVNHRNTRKRCEVCSKFTIKTPENVIGVVLVLLLLTLNIFNTFSSVSIVELKQINDSWEI